MTLLPPPAVGPPDCPAWPQALAISASTDTNAKSCDLTDSDSCCERASRNVPHDPLAAPQEIGNPGTGRPANHNPATAATTKALTASVMAKPCSCSTRFGPSASQAASSPS